jgi:membrane protein
MASLRQKLDDYLIRKIWRTKAGPGRLGALRIKLLRLAYVIFQGFTEEQLILRAMSLVYTTLLSLVPLLAVSFSVLKAFGVHARFLVFLYYFLEPLGESGVDLSMKIIGFVENVNVSVLGSIGLSMLIYTVISTIQKIEGTLNYIWNIKGTRGFSQRFSNYMSVLLIGPVLAFSAIGITAALMSSTLVKKLLVIKGMGTIIYIISRLSPYVLMSAAFTVIYLLLPNTRVRFRAALTGGIAAAILWQTIGWIFTSFIASSAHYSAIYSGFATLILFLIWLYWSFLTLLIGARVSFFIQHPHFREAGDRELVISDRLKEKLALVLMFLIGYNFYCNRKLWTFASLAERLRLPSEFVHEVITILEEKGLIIRSQGEPPSYLPARDIETIPLVEIINSVRVAGDAGSASENGVASIPEVDGVMKRIEKAISSSLEKETLRSLILSAEKSDG